MEVIFQEKGFSDYIKDSISILTGLLTIFIAFSLFEKISLKRKILERQLETVLALIQVLQEWTIFAGAKGLYPGDDPRFFQYGFRIRFFDMNQPPNSAPYRDLFTDGKLYITDKFMDKYPVKGFENNPFLPQRIASILRKLKVTFPCPESPEQTDKAVYLDIDPLCLSMALTGTEKKCFVCYPGGYQDFREFHAVCNELICEINRWLKKYKASDLNLR